MELGVLEVGFVIEPVFGLAEVSGCCGVVDGYVVRGGDEAGEVEELVEMAVAWKWHSNYHYFSLFGDTTVVMA
ncbi:hypothetical protein RHGRI_010543 [Rhododendron griersonianum]|uniref:Uncharacterized protein n=1 Tax=Rhododendron griersonianum TaxID=479676 RepID=A0AAV6KK17_9ERIC|nr:hypothetical protein RHGRI_010543 [Rhododendron griersonianum]